MLSTKHCFVVHFIYFVVLLCCVSCNTTRNLENNNQDVVKIEKVVEHDTLTQFVHDSIYHTIFQRGDTVYETKYIEKTRFRDKVVIRTDTIFHDSIVEKKLEVVVEKKTIPKWCYNSLLLSFVLLCIFLVRCAIWLRKH